MEEKKQLLYKKLNALRLEVDESIVNDIKKTVDEIFASQFQQPNKEVSDDEIMAKLFELGEKHLAHEGRLGGWPKFSWKVTEYIRTLFSNTKTVEQDKKPLSEITEDELSEVKKMLWPNSVKATTKDSAFYIEDMFIDNNSVDDVEPLTIIKVYQYLQSKGYELPVYYPAPGKKGGKE